ncbi:SNF2 family N-terminal domain-containing protein [Apiospora kogelbergensis]|uniref:SNF2 family N-terminal domain-containing protein n=1 Tax=Apiospora kogelbergensis TaxID=1337665 RepID=UPI0031307B70
MATAGTRHWKTKLWPVCIALAKPRKSLPYDYISGTHSKSTSVRLVSRSMTAILLDKFCGKRKLTTKQKVMELQESKRSLAGVLLSPHDGGQTDDSNQSELQSLVSK